MMGKSGIAHMLEHLNFKSTKSMKAGEFDEIVKGRGGVNNASTGFDFTHYYIKSASRNIDNSLSLFADMMQNLLLLDEEFQPERDVVTEERRWRTDNSPIGYLYFRLFNNAFIYHPYHWTPIGFMQDIRNWSIDDIKSFHNTFYQPNNAIVVVSGDINESEIFTSVETHFKDIKRGPKIPEVHMVEPEQDGAKNITVYKENQVEVVALTYHIPNFQHEDIVALSAIGEILSAGKSSRLTERLIDKKQMVNQIYAYSMDLIDPGVFLLLAVCNPGIKATDVEAELIDELKRLSQNTITQDELDKIKINTKAEFIYTMESASGVSNLFGSYLARGDLKPLLEYEDKLDKLTIKEIESVAKKYFQDKNRTTAILKAEPNITSPAQEETK
jgi:predicted Zn-dependent peptidase